MVFEQYTMGHGKWPKNEAEIKKAALCTSGQYVKWTTLNNMLWNYIIQAPLILNLCNAKAVNESI